MFVSFTDWEFDGDVDKAVEGIKANWTATKVYGAIELKHKTFRIKLHLN